MQKFVHSYLSSYFEVKKLKYGKHKFFGFDAIHLKIDNDIIFSDRLLKELVLAAYIDEVRLRRFVDEWVKINFPNTNLEVYWKTLEPLNRKIILERNPEEARARLRNGRVYDEELVQNIREQVNRLQADQQILTLGELEHPGPPIFISSRKEKDLDNTE